MPQDRWTAGLPAVLRLRPGERWRHRLLSAAAAGSSWRIELIGGDPGCVAARIVLEPGPAPTAEPGGPPPETYGVPEVVEVWAVRPGRASWRLRLGQPWTPERPVAEHVVDVQVS